MSQIYDLIRVLVKTYQAVTDRRIKTRIIETWLRVFILHRFDSGRRTAKVAGFKVKFLNFNILSHLFKELFIENEYYFTTEKSNPYIIDCGSNIGMSILYFKMMYPESRIVGFEPGDEAFLCLEENVKNNLLKFVTVHKVALSDREGYTDFYYDPEDPGSLYMSTIQERFPKQKRRVKVSLLSKYINEEIDFLKIDTEGAELDILQELNNAGKLTFIRQMVIEYHHHINKSFDDLSRILVVLEKCGFGYQIESTLGRPFRRGQFQDILVYAYQKQSNV